MCYLNNNLYDKSYNYFFKRFPSDRKPADFPCFRRNGRGYMALESGEHDPAKMVYRISKSVKFPGRRLYHQNKDEIFQRTSSSLFLSHENVFRVNKWNWKFLKILTHR